MAFVASQLVEEVTAHAQSGSLEDAREICADGTYFPNNLRIYGYLLSIYNTCCGLFKPTSHRSAYKHKIRSRKYVLYLDVLRCGAGEGWKRSVGPIM